MWIFTRDGFYSAVQHNESSDLLQVRARRRDDLERLAAAVGYSDAPIIELPDADYRWRLNVQRDDFAGYMSRAVESIDYETNVKGTLARGDKARKSAMMSVWSAMYSLQERQFDVDPDQLELFEWDFNES